MKKIILIVLMFSVSAHAGTWCQWSGSELDGWSGTNCKSTSRTFILLNGVRVSVSAENLNPRGWYGLTETHPALGENEIEDETIWGFADNEISRTWTVRDMTQEEIDTRDAMALSDYYQWRIILEVVGVTPQQLQANMSAESYQELIKAYQARERLED